MEASFCGSDVGIDKGFFYTIQHLENMGQMFGRTLYDYFYIENPPLNTIAGAGAVAVAAESEIKPLNHKLKSTNTLVNSIFSKIKEEIKLGNSNFLETFGSSDSDTSSDEEGLRILKRKSKLKTKSNSFKIKSKPSKLSDTPTTSKEKFQIRKSTTFDSKIKPRTSQTIPRTQSLTLKENVFKPL